MQPVQPDSTDHTAVEHDTRTADHLRDFVDEATIALHWVDGDGIIVWANKAELDLLGYSSDEYIGHPISAFHADPEKIRDILQRLGRNETLKEYEARLRCRDGSIKIVSISSNVFWNEGKFVHSRCFTVDITALRAAESALRQSESLYRQLIGSLPSAIYTTDAAGRITFYNQAAVELWGREPQIGVDLWCGSLKINKPDGSVLPLESCPMAITLKEGKPVRGEEIIVTQPNGQQRHVLPHPQPLFDEAGNLTGAVNMLADITDMKRSHEALQESENKYRLLSNSLERKVDERSADLMKKNMELKKSEERYHKMVEEVEDYAILLLDRTGIIQNWNVGAQKIKGYTEAEVIGRNFRIFYLPEDQEDGLPEKLIDEAVRNGKAVHEGWRVRKDSTLFWGSIVITALHDKENNIIGFSKVTRDLSDRKLAEDKIKQYASVLEFQNKELEQFAYAASHDLKEPLRKIQFYNSYLTEKNAGQLDEKGREYLNRSIAAAKRMQQLIEDILSYSKASSDADTFEQVDLTEIAEEIALLYTDETDSGRTRIKIGKLPLIRAIPFQVRQLLDNLVGNAIKYKHPDRVSRIQITARTVQGLHISHPEAISDLSYHELSIIDNGTGFDQAYSQKIFEIFQRLHTQTAFAGSGIGLAICKKIMQKHDGFITATGKPNEGARFNVYFPV